MVPTFLDRTSPPDATSLAAALGPAVGVWNSARERLAATRGPLEESWAWSGAKAGWSLRLARRGRPIAYLTPLWHGVDLCRSLSLGTATPGRALLHVGYLSAWVAGGAAVAVARYRAKLVT